ncbi:Putative alpha helical protein [Salmonella enterica subsp. enterica serovar Minnesota str. A4-603]|nr:Putative alpha helical protein [Salmonella enterica subsp. enterica serovar Minnesota str. A4-603]
MNKVAQYYRELVASLSERLRNGERDIDALVEQARQRVMQTGELTRTEVDELTRAVYITEYSSRTDARCQTRSGRVRHELRREPGR